MVSRLVDTLVLALLAGVRSKSRTFLLSVALQH